MANLNELYKSLLATMKDHGQKAEPLDTLVWMVRYHKVSSSEHQALTMHMRRNRPTAKLHSKFFHHPNYSPNPKSQYWWRVYNDDTRQQMRLFIKKMIKITRDE